MGVRTVARGVSVLDIKVDVRHDGWVGWMGIEMRGSEEREIVGVKRRGSRGPHSQSHYWIQLAE